MGNSNGKPVVLTDEINLNHFRLLRVVGKGAFGKVRIVERKDTGLTFALKYIRKDEVVRSESVRNIIRERRMLEHLNHPFLCNLRYSFQDMQYLYIVVDLMNGGDLRFHITRKTFTEEAVRFWIAELGCALRYIHSQGIVHRDVKPDNVLLDSEGHVHLADFNVASDFTPKKQLTSKSGTLAYLAPEVYKGKGYTSQVDWWSLGVLFYECIYNKRPFDASHHDALAAAIVKAEPPFPLTSPAVSQPCLHAISSLLEKDKSLRIGAAGFRTFTENPFFQEIDFEALERKEVEPIFCPSSEKTNFDATYDLEELLLEEAPLEARARKQKPRAELREDATQQEIRAEELHKMIETMFKPFNYEIASTDNDDAGTSSTTPATASDQPPARQHHHAQSTAGSPVDNPPTSPQLPPHAGPYDRAHTPGSASWTRSSAHSPDGSPPLAAAALSSAYHAGPSSPHDPPTNGCVPNKSTSSGPTSHPQSHFSFKPRVATFDGRTTPPSPSSAHPPKRPKMSSRSASLGSFKTDEQAAWNGGAASPPALSEERRSEKPTGMLGFLNRKKGRDRSPRGKERERGVIGKEGARVVVSHG